jgi:hypothetical protein
MKKIIHLLTFINKPFKKYLFIIIPLASIILNLYGILFYKLRDQFSITGNLVTIFVIILLTFLYILLGKSNLFYIAGIITMFYISIITFLTKCVEFNTLAGVSSIAVFMIMTVISLIVGFAPKQHI